MSKISNVQLENETEKEWLLESILNNSNQMIQVSDLETYSMIYANQAARIYTGHENQPYVGEHCYKYMMGLDEQCPFCPMRQMKKSECQETEVDNGNEIYVVKTKIAEWKGKKVFIEYAWDITEIRRSQRIFEIQMQMEEKQELIEYEQHLKEQLEIFNALSRDYLNIFLIDAETNTAKILKLDGYVTTGLKKDSNIAYPYEATCLQYISERVHPDDQKMMREALQIKRVLQELSKKTEYVSSYKTLVNGEKHYYQFKYMRLENTPHIVAGFQNIDTLIAKEREVQETLEAALRAEERSNRAKSMFMNSMSHDIRTPLNAIIGCTTLATTHIEEKEAVKEYLSKITTAGNHLLSLVNDILDVNHIETGNVQIDFLPLHLPDLIKELEMIIQPEVLEKKLQLNIKMEEMIHKDILADSLKLKQVFLNILSNSVKFTKPGGSIFFKVKEVQDASEEYGSYQFYIKDNGIGMSKEFVNHIFETFSREQTVTVSGIQGSGLGMAIVKNIVDLLGGDIQVTSESGKGTESVVSLRFRICDSKIEAKELSDKVIDFTGKKILLVEDNELNREIAVELLQEAGFIVDTAEDGTIAVEKVLHAVPGQYDLILMDIQMPLMDGYEATKRIKKFASPEIAKIPIIAMTANAFAEDRQKAFRAGMNGYIPKPIDIEKMLETLKQILEDQMVSECITKK